MTKLTRLTGKIFGETASPTGDDPEIGQFGSAKLGTYNGTSDVATIQGLPAWSNGWIDAVTPSNQYPPLPERTGVDKVLSYQECYLLQQGVAEWDSATTYYTNGFCAYDGTIYKSVADSNLNNQPDESPDYWTVYGAITDYANQDLTNLTNLGNARLQYAPFAINSGDVLNGENNTLTMPADSQTEIEVQWIRPNLTANGTLGGDSFAVGGDTQYSTRYYYCAVDGLNNTFWDSANSTANHYYIFYNPDALKVTSLTIKNDSYPDGYSYSSAAGYVQGSNNGSSWTTITSYTNSSTGKGAEWTIDLSSNTTFYNYYRIVSTQNAGGLANWNWAIAELNITATYMQQISAGDSIICAPCIITSCDGRTAIHNDVKVYEITTEADGNYAILKHLETGDLSLAGSPVFSKTAPATSSDGDCWVDVSTIPAKLKVYDIANSVWAPNSNLVYIGDCTILNYVVTNVTNRRFNDSGYIIEKQYTPKDEIYDYTSGISITTSQIVNNNYDMLLIFYKTTNNGASAYCNVYYGNSSSDPRIVLGGTTNAAGYFCFTLPLFKNTDYYIELGGTYSSCTIYPKKGVE